MSEIRELGNYSISEAAQYLRIPRSTLKSWVHGQRKFRPIITPPRGDRETLSFVNLVEIHVLDAIRKGHGLPLQKVRKALDYLQRAYPSHHPLADHVFETDGLDLFIEKFGTLINISQSGQIEMKEMVKTYLKRIERDKRGVPIRLYPFTRRKDPEECRAIVIDPAVSFGRPVIAGTGVPTSVIIERFRAGDSIPELQEDFRLSLDQVEEAIRCEQIQEAA